ncbi:hypothetical protein [Amycolatopsis sp. CA-230715]|uniref:hypothetical protein n=1 Tax=Amycolatopsis sp. CA-230715 TaxID=2745196 RepID=UPI001C01A746|nr:hypothetical protein [Amycolatopsis sp. CA-230715]QWF86084.1 hypothetical protein HUW46_09565 [Amycolatopsis sp. CA-230715]
MSKASDAAAAKAAKLAERARARALAEAGGTSSASSSSTSPAGSDEVTAADREQHLAPVVDTPHVKPIRSTVDLLPARHRKFKDWCSETATMIGSARVTTQDVFRVVVERLSQDEGFADKVRDDLRKLKSQ